VFETGLIILHVIACVILVTLVLMQQGRGAEAGAALGAGASASVFGARGSATFLSRSTAAVALFLLATSLGLNAFYVHRGHGTSVTQRYPAQAPKQPQTPGAPGVSPPTEGGVKPSVPKDVRPRHEGPADIPNANEGNVPEDKPSQTKGSSRERAPSPLPPP
jgi:preprotein translocase subunit SecG